MKVIDSTEGLKRTCVEVSAFKISTDQWYNNEYLTTICKAGIADIDRSINSRYINLTSTLISCVNCGKCLSILREKVNDKVKSYEEQLSFMLETQQRLR